MLYIVNSRVSLVLVYRRFTFYSFYNFFFGFPATWLTISFDLIVKKLPKFLSNDIILIRIHTQSCNRQNSQFVIEKLAMFKTTNKIRI